MESKQRKINIVRRSARYVLWRVNPKYCTYEDLDEEGSYFSSAAMIGNLNLDYGDMLCVVASGTTPNLLGIWQAERKQIRKELKLPEVYPYIGKHKQKRMKYQHRVFASLKWKGKQNNYKKTIEILGTKFKASSPCQLNIIQYEALRKLTFN